MTDSLISPIDMKSLLPSRVTMAGGGATAIDLSQAVKPTADEVLQQFQGILLGEMMKSMRETVPESGLFGDESAGREMFQSLLDQEYVGAAGRQMGGLGLTEALKRQLGLADQAKKVGQTAEAAKPTTKTT